MSPTTPLLKIKPWKGAQYGCLEMPLTSIEVLLRVYLLAHFSDVVKLDPRLTGLALLLSLAWDAWMEPWVGRQSDAWLLSGRSRWTWVLAGALATGAALIAMFAIPAGWAQGTLFFALLATSMLLNSSLAVCSVPFAALVGDAEGGEKTRSHLIGWRGAFANAGALLGIAVPGFFITQQDPAPLSQSVWLFVILLFLLAFFSSLSRSLFRPHEKSIVDLSNDETEFSFGWKNLISWNHASLPSRPFLLLLTAGFLVHLGLTLSTSTALYYYKLYLRFSEDEVQQILLLLFASSTVTIPFWMWAGHRFGMLRALVAGGVLLGVSTMVIAIRLPASELGPALLWASLCGGFLLSSTILYERLLIQLGQQGYGFVFGVWRMTIKIGRALGVATAAVCLSWAGIQGFDPRVGDRLAVVFGPGVGGLILISAGLLYIYRHQIRPALR